MTRLVDTGRRRKAGGGGHAHDRMAIGRIRPVNAERLITAVILHNFVIRHIQVQNEPDNEKNSSCAIARHHAVRLGWHHPGR